MQRQHQSNPKQLVVLGPTGLGANLQFLRGSSSYTRHGRAGSAIGASRSGLRAQVQCYQGYQPGPCRRHRTEAG